jgi:hypothetical protein
VSGSPVFLWSRKLRYLSETDAHHTGNPSKVGGWRTL